MKSHRTTHFAALCLLLTLVSTPSSALTLGRMHGTALVGKELDLSVPVQFAPEDDVSAVCFVVDVAYGDTALSRSRITLSSQVGSQPHTQVVRIRSSERVDEAVVSVNLKAVCLAKASRRYVLLSEVLSETVSDAALIAPPLPSASSVSTAVIGKGVVPPGPPLVASESRVPSPVALTKPVPRQVLKPSPKPVSKHVAASKTEHDGAVKALNHAQTAALDDLQRRVDAISKSQASSHTADDLLKFEAREKALESDLKGLRLLSAKNQQSIQAVSAILDKAESENYGSWVVYGLAALLLACLGFLTFVLIRLRRNGRAALPWWSESDDASRRETQPLRDAELNELKTPSPALATPVVSEVPPAPAPKPAPASAPTATPSAATGASEPVVGAREAEYGGESFWPIVQAESLSAAAVALKSAAAAPAEPTGAGNLQTGHASLKAISTQEMLDVRQQAEFFMALGQHDEAVQLLKDSIQTSADANPLVYLDLLKIFHTLSRRTEFEQVRADFNQQFTGRIPEYSSFLLEGNGLEGYDDICQQIVVLWPTEYTIDFIEQCLVRTAEDDPEQGIDLQAFKDLLLLYGVLKRLDQTPTSSVLPFSASRATPALSALAPSASQAGTVEVGAIPSFPVLSGVQTPSVKPGTDLDIDLDLDLNFDLDLDLDLTAEPDKKTPTDNLIDFDMSGFKLPKPLGEHKK